MPAWCRFTGAADGYIMYPVRRPCGFQSGTRYASSRQRTAFTAPLWTGRRCAPGSSPGRRSIASQAKPAGSGSASEEDSDDGEYAVEEDEPELSVDEQQRRKYESTQDNFDAMQQVTAVTAGHAAALPPRGHTGPAVSLCRCVRPLLSAASKLLKSDLFLRRISTCSRRSTGLVPKPPCQRLRCQGMVTASAPRTSRTGGSAR